MLSLGLVVVIIIFAAVFVVTASIYVYKAILDTNKESNVFVLMVPSLLNAFQVSALKR